MKNAYRVEGEIVYIEVICKGVTHEVLIDKDDLNKVSELAKNVTLDPLYAVFWVEGIRYRLHRFINNPSEGKHVDHINGNRLDNRKANLRAVTNRENCNNVNNNYKVGMSGVKGVIYNTSPGRRKRWNVKIRRKSYGYYHTLEEATKVANKIHKELRKEFEKEVG